MEYKVAPNYTVIPNYIYLYHLDKYLLLPMYPDQAQDSLGSTFANSTGLSRTAPVFSYSYSGPRTITVNLAMHRDMMRDLNKDVSNLKDNVVDFNGDDYVDTLIAHLQAMALPKYNNYSNGSKALIPPMVAIRFGDDIFIKGVVNGGINVNHGKPILKNNKYAKVDVSFTVYETEPFDADSVSTEGSFRGITKTFKSGIFKDSYSSGNGTYTEDEVVPKVSDNEGLNRGNGVMYKGMFAKSDSDGSEVTSTVTTVKPISAPIGVYATMNNGIGGWI